MVNTHFADLTRALRRRWSSGRDESCLPPDPFHTLAVQLRLSRMAVEVRSLERDRDGRWARAHHLAAALGAYDDLLVEAALLSGIPVPDATPAVRRLMLEGELRHGGWSW